jgi:anti-sigma factor RsiW
MNSIEEKLWNYIDGTCSPEEQQAISTLIETDEAYRRQYEELLALNLEFSSIELDEPPMAFTYRVMEAIRTEEAQVPLKAAINKNLIRGLFSVFVFIIMAAVLYALFNINWSAGSSATAHFSLPQVKLPVSLPPAQNVLTSTPVLKAFIFFDVVFGLFFLDTYLRKQRTSKEM